MSSTDFFNIPVLIEALRSVTGTSGPTALHEPHFGGNEWTYVKECLDTGWVSSAGKFVDRFEAELADYTGVKRAVAVVNGTAALHICLLLADVKAGDEVLMPTLTFVATANAASYCNAIPHFVDSELQTLGVDPIRLAEYLDETTEQREDGCYNRFTGRRIRALVPMHTFGHPVELDPLVRICDQHRIILIEDAAESLGSFYKGRHTGQWGRLSALSFNGNKTITTGGGGALLTNDDDLGRLAKHITTTAKCPHRWEFNHDMVGYNYRMPNINAALGCAQLEQLPAFLAAKRLLSERYREALTAVDGIGFFIEPPNCRSNYWLNTLLLDEPFADQRDAVLAATNDAGIMTRPAWTLMHRLPQFSASPRMSLSTAEDLAKRIINIPSSAFINQKRC